MRSRSKWDKKFSWRIRLTWAVVKCRYANYKWWHYKLCMLAHLVESVFEFFTLCLQNVLHSTCIDTRIFLTRMLHTVHFYLEVAWRWQSWHYWSARMRNYWTDTVILTTLIHKDNANKLPPRFQFQNIIITPFTIFFNYLKLSFPMTRWLKKKHPLARGLCYGVLLKRNWSLWLTVNYNRTIPDKPGEFI